MSLERFKETAEYLPCEKLMQGSYCSQRVFCTGIITGEAETGYLIDVDDEESSPTGLSISYITKEKTYPLATA
jgi:hypothetical protein